MLQTRYCSNPLEKSIEMNRAEREEYFCKWQKELEEKGFKVVNGTITKELEN